MLDRFTRTGLWCRAGCEAEDHLLRKECLAPLLLILFAERMIGATPILSWRAAAFILAKRTPGEIKRMKKTDLLGVNPPATFLLPKGIPGPQKPNKGGKREREDDDYEDKKDKNNEEQDKRRQRKKEGPAAWCVP